MRALMSGYTKMERTHRCLRSKSPLYCSRVARVNRIAVLLKLAHRLYWLCLLLIEFPNLVKTISGDLPSGLWLASAPTCTCSQQPPPPNQPYAPQGWGNAYQHWQNQSAPPNDPCEFWPSFFLCVLSSCSAPAIVTGRRVVDVAALASFLAIATEIAGPEYSWDLSVQIGFYGLFSAS